MEVFSTYTKLRKRLTFLLSKAKFASQAETSHWSPDVGFYGIATPFA
jgi:hypothetical protein